MQNAELSKDAKGDAGLTLIEMLVALAIAGLTLALVFQGVGFGHAAWERTVRQDEELARLLAVEDFLRARIEAAYATDNLERPQTRIDADELSFPAPLPPELGVGGTYLFQLYLKGDGATRDLTIRWQVWRPEQEGFDPARPLVERVLLADVASLTLAFARQSDADGNPLWLAPTEGAIDLPPLLSIDVGFAAGDRRIWPVLIVQPKLSLVP